MEGEDVVLLDNPIAGGLPARQVLPVEKGHESVVVFGRRFGMGQSAHRETKHREGNTHEVLHGMYSWTDVGPVMLPGPK